MKRPFTILNPPKKKELRAAFFIHCSAVEIAESFLDIFRKQRRSRKAKGLATDEEQDLLRAMLVFACSGLDSMVKQLIADALPNVIRKDEGAASQFKQHIERRIKKLDQFDYKFLASVLGEPSPFDWLLRDMIATWQSQSLQSRDQLLKAAAAFAMPTHRLSKDLKLLDRIFKVRNQIAHEMDVDLTQQNGSRRPRAEQDMIDLRNEVFRIAETFLREVEAKL